MCVVLFSEIHRPVTVSGKITTREIDPHIEYSIPINVPLCDIVLTGNSKEIL